MAARKKSIKQQVRKANQPKGKAKAKTAKPAPKTNQIPAKVIKLKPPKSPFKQSEFFNTLAEQSQLSKKQAKEVLENIKAIAKVHLIKNGPGQLTIPGICKLTVVTKPATKARKGINPFTGEETMFKAKPARKIVKIKVLKKFKSEIE